MFYQDIIEDISAQGIVVDGGQGAQGPALAVEELRALGLELLQLAHGGAPAQPARAEPQPAEAGESRNAAVELLNL